jgi:hypothetical protein
VILSLVQVLKRKYITEDISMSAGPGQAHEKAARSKSHKFQNLSLALQALHPQSKVV